MHKIFFIVRRKYILIIYIYIYMNSVFICEAYITRTICNILNVGWKTSWTKLYRVTQTLIMVLNCFVGTYIEPNEQFRVCSIDLSNKSSHRFVIEIATWILLSRRENDLNLVSNPNFSRWIKVYHCDREKVKIRWFFSSFVNCLYSMARIQSTCLSINARVYHISSH